MNWFQRHLNWTVVLAAIGAYAIAIAAGFGLLIIDPFAPEEGLELLLW